MYTNAAARGWRTQAEPRREPPIMIININDCLLNCLLNLYNCYNCNTC